MKTARRRSIVSLLVVMCLTFCLRVVAVSEEPESDRERAAAALEYGQSEAALYTIRPADRDDKSIKLHEESVLRWHNSVDQSVHGNIFVWTKAGRPEVVASIYQFYSPKTDFCAEFQSLSVDPLVIEKDGKEVWTPKEPGIVLKPFEGAAEPSPSKPQRLVQMRKLAGEFSVQLTDYSRETYRLRLLPRPLLRYGSADSEVLDGALFAFTYTTDPELLVMVEARKSEKGFRWQYGLARMNIGELKVSHRDREIWTAERLQHPYLYKEGIYTLFMGLPLPEKRENEK
jgi:hypothetical protein